MSYFTFCSYAGHFFKTELITENMFTCSSSLQILAFLCMACCAPAFYSTQHWFLLVVTLCFLGTTFLCFYHLFLDTYLKGANVNWTKLVSVSPAPCRQRSIRKFKWRCSDSSSSKRFFLQLVNHGFSLKSRYSPNAFVSEKWKIDPN